MRGFLLGVLVGAAVGGGGVYLWRTERGAGATAAAGDAGAVAAAPASGGGGKRRRPRGGRRGAGRVAAADRGAAGGELTGETADGLEGTDLEAVDPGIVLSAADLAPVWRGDSSVKAPARSVDFAGGAEGRALEQGEIDEGVSRGSDGITRCLVAARGDAPVVGSVTLEMLVGGDGRVARLRMKAPAYLWAHGLEACARRATGAMRFEATGASTVVTVPFEIR